MGGSAVSHPLREQARAREQAPTPERLANGSGARPGEAACGRLIIVSSQPIQLGVGIPGRDEAWLRAARRARILSWISVAWMGAEGVLGIALGVLAGSIALIGFGFDSFIEGIASLVIVWRFTGARLHSEVAEQRAQKLVAAQFFILAPLVAFEALRQLINGDEPSVSWLGIVLATTSLIGMPLLGIAKRRLADQLGSAATRGGELRTFYARTSPLPSSSDCWGTRCSACGGWIRWPRL